MKSLFLWMLGAWVFTGSTIHKQWNKTVAQNGFAVVELFTSEGCSSCPSADQAVAKLMGSQKNIIILAYHVDYWNSLGWKDPFSDHLYSKRQQQYASIFGLSSVYTPQVVVNGVSQFVGSDESQLHQSIDKALLQAAPASLQVEAVQDKTLHLQVVCHGQGNIKGDLHVAIVQDRAVTDVRAGENSGRVLHHVNIVRDFQTGSFAQGPATFVLALPTGLSAADCRVIAFLQDVKTGVIQGAAETGIK